ncbi:acetyl-CoA carboxylase, carboxyltransferase subunit beta [Pseudonocardia tropica]|uniref:acetyl-CoA carboxylase, carboxyltransferase subunit beta n=1 Tax=Pseudonocardia tropica TaxID=681289 RepID=UPI003CD074E0
MSRPVPREAPVTITPERGWLQCPGCQALLYRRRYDRTDRVCPECGAHGALTAPERLANLLDEGSVTPFTTIHSDVDPLGFVDAKPYPQRVAEARRRTGLDEAVLCARGELGGHRVVVAAMDFRFLGGSLGCAVGEAITAAGEVALAERTPLVIVCASGGARMQEGVLALMQMAKTAQMLSTLREAGLLTVSLVTDPTYGGVAASFATLCDVIVAEPGARMGFAGRRVIEQTIRERLPAGFQTAEHLLAHGMIDRVVPRAELREILGRLLGFACAPVADGDRTGPTTLVRELSRREPWEAVRHARDIGRPTTVDYIAHVVEDFVELHGDRRGTDDPAVVAGLGRLHGRAVAVVGTQKGHDAAELSARRFGMPEPAGYRKAARVMRLAETLSLPVVTLVDTAGAHPGVEAELHGQSVAVAENIATMAGLTVPIVAVVTGEGGSGGALALAVADQVLACSDAVYSVISPEGCASILWQDAAQAPRAAAALQVDAASLLRLGVIDGVVPEPPGGAHTDPAATAHALADAVSVCLRRLDGVPAAELVHRRRARFRAFGAETGRLPAVERETA